MTSRVVRILEGVVILLGLAVFWPYVFGYRSAWYSLVTIPVLILLVIVAVARMRRVRRALHDAGSVSPPLGPPPYRGNGRH